MKITINDKGVKLASQTGFKEQLQSRKIRCLIDFEGDEITEFVLLVDGSTYTCGPTVNVDEHKDSSSSGSSSSSSSADYVLTAPPAKFTGCLKNKGYGAYAVCFALAMLLVCMAAVIMVLHRAATISKEKQFWTGVRDSYIASLICIFISLAPEVCHPNTDNDQMNQKYAMRFGVIFFFVGMGIVIASLDGVSVGVSVSTGGVVSLLQWGIELLLCTESFRVRTCLFCESWGCRCCGFRARSGKEKRNSGVESKCDVQSRHFIQVLDHPT